MKILIVDNYDSFTYNLVHLVRKITGGEVTVRMNDEIEPGEAVQFEKIILSPGPGLPAEAGNLLQLIREISGKVPILGVCLGHQAIGEAFGAKLYNLEKVYHGVATRVEVEEGQEGRGIFRDLPRRFEIGRYHSWIVMDKNLPVEFAVTARDENGYIMAMEHKVLDLEGVQFHPESVLTPFGEQIMLNWLNKTSKQ